MINIKSLKQEMNFLNNQLIKIYGDKNTITEMYVECSDILIAYYTSYYSDELGLYYLDQLQKILNKLSKDLSTDSWEKIKSKIPTIFKFIGEMNTKYICL